MYVKGVGGILWAQGKLAGKVLELFGFQASITLIQKDTHHNNEDS